MEWCCDPFRNGYDFRQERGLLVFAQPRGAAAMSQPLFHIAFRALERNRQDALREAIKGRMEGCMTLSCCIAIKFCPWCGVKLAEFYGDSWHELVDQQVIDEFIFC
jgi:hypothetical protein